MEHSYIVDEISDAMQGVSWTATKNASNTLLFKLTKAQWSRYYYMAIATRLLGATWSYLLL